MINTHLFLSNKLMTGGSELVEVWRENPQAIIWVDLFENAKAVEAKFLETEFDLHPLAIQDAQRARHPPKIEIFEDHSFLLLKGLSAESVNIDFKTIQLALFVGERFVVTRHSGSSMSISRLEDMLAGDTTTYFNSGAKLALFLCRLMVKRYLKILLELEPRLEELEELMLDRPNDTMLAELIRYKSDLKRLRRFAIYHEQIFRELKDKSCPGFENAERKHEIIDVWEQHERTHSLSQLYYETASDLIDGYISISSHRLNQIMKILTIVMAIFVPLSFLAGIYGMNFENMPELHSKSGYFILLGIMASVATVLMLIFRRIRWL